MLISYFYRIVSLKSGLLLIDIQHPQEEKALLVAVRLKSTPREVAEEHLQELEELARSAGAITVAKILQDRDYPDHAFYIGKGKVEEITAFVDEQEINLIIFDDDLSPAQVRNLERVINRKIVDRSGLILDIFAKRARTKEARTQVELAQLEYMLPRLTRAWTHLSKQYGGVGTKGPGETQIETDRRLIRDRIKMLREKLEKIDERRDTQTAQRNDCFKCALVGYTNVGKSTLFNRLVRAEVTEEDKLFATLDTTTRMLDLGLSQPVLLSDTVGFIRKLPHQLVASFQSTLKDTRDADLLLHIVDCSHPGFRDQIKAVTATLEVIGCSAGNELLVFNKVDAIADENIIEQLQHEFGAPVFISALKEYNLAYLKDFIKRRIEANYIVEEISLPMSKLKQYYVLREFCDILSEKYTEEGISASIKLHVNNLEKMKRTINA